MHYVLFKETAMFILTPIKFLPSRYGIPAENHNGKKLLITIAVFNATDKIKLCPTGRSNLINLSGAQRLVVFSRSITTI